MKRNWFIELYIIADYFDVGEPAFVCRWYKAAMWYEERVSKHRNTSIPEFSMCCMQGRINIARFGKLSQPLHDLDFKIIGNQVFSRKH